MSTKPVETPLYTIVFAQIILCDEWIESRLWWMVCRNGDLPFEVDTERSIETVTQQQIITIDLSILLKYTEAMSVGMKYLGLFSLR
jgi:hypothetical protein